MAMTAKHRSKFQPFTGNDDIFVLMKNSREWQKKGKYKKKKPTKNQQQQRSVINLVFRRCILNYIMCIILTFVPVIHFLVHLIV